MFSSKVLKIVLIPAVTLVAEAKFSKEKEDCLCRPSELPIYEEEAKRPKKVVAEGKEAPPKFIEESFATVRRNITKLTSEIGAYKRVGQDFIGQSKENAEWLLEYLREEDNLTPKAGAIAIGGLTGLILGLRGGFFKKTLYAGIGALGMASVCYPKEAAEYSQIGIAETKKYLTIGYNFAYGVKKGDQPLELPSLPQLPGSLSEVWDTVSKSASSLVSGEGDKNGDSSSTPKK